MEFTEILRELGLRIQRARLEAGFTQEQASCDAGIDYKRWQRLEEGSVNPTVKTLHRVAAALNVPFWELFSPLQRRRTSRDNVPHASGAMPKVSRPPPRVSGELRITREERETIAPQSRRPKTRGQR